MKPVDGLPSRDDVGPVTGPCGHINWHATAEEHYLTGNYQAAIVAALMDLGNLLEGPALLVMDLLQAGPTRTDDDEPAL